MPASIALESTSLISLMADAESNSKPVRAMDASSDDEDSFMVTVVTFEWDGGVLAGMQQFSLSLMIRSAPYL
jgi:hypothetical protein